MKEKEIGSEFHISQLPHVLTSERDNDAEYVLSGRTAIGLIIRMLNLRRNVERVYMPAYGCESMVEPFLRNGIKVVQYDMHLSSEGLQYNIDCNKQTDILYVNNYFGYDDTLSLNIVRQFKQRGAFIIYDRTHSMLMADEEMQVLADYSFCSIRKWMGVVTGAFITSPEGRFNPTLDDVDYWQDKAIAMMVKAKYLEGSMEVDKSLFLDAFGRFGYHLSEDYENKRMDDFSYSIWKHTDLDTMREQRRKNARMLHEGVNGVRHIADFNDNSCPLFVPVFFNNKGDRDRVRRALIDASIYCPVHWPKNRLVKDEMRVNELFDTELSLICDQRYDESDMKRIIEIVNKSIES